MRIALISAHASPLAQVGGDDSGGQNVYVAEVARQLGRRGYRVDVFTRRDNALLPEVVEWQPNVRVVHLNAGPARFVPKEELLAHMEAFSEALIAFSARGGDPYDLAHANFFMSGLAAEQLTAVAGTPFVITFHGLAAVRRHWQGDNDRSPPCRHAIEKRLMRSATRVIAECPQDMTDMLTWCDAPAQRLALAPCGFDPLQFQPVERRIARRILGWPEHEYAVLQLGRLVPRKGIANTIRGLAESLRHGVRDTRLYIMGGNSTRPDPLATPEIARLREVAADAGVAARVRFLGRVEREVLNVYYSAADVFVTTPWYEPFGITPLEAMACGTPVIGTRVGGIQYTVRDGATGLLVPPEDPARLGVALAALYHDPARRRALGAAGRVRAAEFTWNHVVDALLRIYAEALPAGKAARLAAPASPKVVPFLRRAAPRRAAPSTP
ncbi:MAG: glycosyltransferase [Gammaproteobacteria bacterium]